MVQRWYHGRVWVKPRLLPQECREANQKYAGAMMLDVRILIGENVGQSSEHLLDWSQWPMIGGAKHLQVKYFNIRGATKLSRILLAFGE